MEIFLDEVSQFLTRLENLKWSDWLGLWSHDIGMRFHEIWCLTRCWMWFGLKKMWNILLKMSLTRVILNKMWEVSLKKMSLTRVILNKMWEVSLKKMSLTTVILNKMLEGSLQKMSLTRVIVNKMWGLNTCAVNNTFTSDVVNHM